MNTQLIYCSKDTASVYNEEDGSFKCAVSQGIHVKQNDKISVQSIAIQSRGVGSDIIEIPTKIQNYLYKTNVVQLESWFYIHHNCDNTAPLPIGLITENPQFSEVFATDTDTGYGYMTGNVIWEDLGPAHPPPLGPLLKTTKLFTHRSMGQRLYVGTYVWNPANGIQPSVLANHNITPATALFTPLKSYVEIGIDTGYDNPSNIANSITADLHSADVSPNFGFNNRQPPFTSTNQTLTELKLNTTTNYENTNSVLQEDTLSGTGQTFQPQFDITSLNSSVITILGDYGQGRDPPQYGNNYYGGWVATNNPFLHFYGSRLLQASSIKENALFTNTTQNKPALDTEIYYSYGGGDISGNWTEGAVLTTNLQWNEANLTLVRDLLHSQKQLENPDNNYSTKQLKTAESWESFIDIGRQNDQSDPTSTAGITPLFPPMSAATSTPNGGINPADTTPFDYLAVFTKTYFDAAFQGKAFLSAAELLDKKTTITSTHGLEWSNGQTLYPADVCRVLDFNVCCVFDFFGKFRIGLIRKAGSISPPLQDKQYCLVNLSAQNPRNFMALVYGNKPINPLQATVYPPKPITQPADTVMVDRRVHLGAPNWNMIFDSTRGRFGFSNMSWAHMETNKGLTALNDSAGNEIITLNNFTDPSNANVYAGFVRNPPFTKYAQSGIGLVNIKVQNLNTDAWEPIDYENPIDVDNKFTHSLLHRLGFDYYKLLNKQGSPPIIFQERHWNSSIPRPFANFFPFPTTTNAQLDTSMAISMDVGTINTGTSAAPNNVVVPFYGLGLQTGNMNVNISSESATIYASDLPSKLVYPFWLIRSDIIEGVSFHSQNVGSRDNILAVCSRSYLAGDFAFKMGEDYEFTATKDYVITEINTSILNPDLSPADVEGKTSVIYKITSPIPLFQIQQENLQKNRRKE